MTRFSFSAVRLWFLAALGLGCFEIIASSSRYRVTIESTTGSKAALNRTVPPLVVPVTGGVLVLGNPQDRAIRVVLRARPASPNTSSASLPLALSQSVRRVCLELPGPVREQQPTPVTSESSEIGTRVFFLSIGPRFGSDAWTEAIPCQRIGGNARVSIFVDLAAKSRLNPGVIDEIQRLSDSGLGTTVESLAGRVPDRDSDGTLAIVLTPRLARIPRPTPVDGLTRAVDFFRHVPRPESNGADVLFLNSSLLPGAHLRAVLAHEWCHAAVLGHLADALEASGPAALDGWLNEAVAHWVETRAAGARTNIQHRIDAFYARPSQASLWSDPSEPDTAWGRDGSRGAGYLFLEWCAAEQPELITRLVRGNSLTRLDLEREMGATFPDLFRNWTCSLGRDAVAAGGQSLHAHPKTDTWNLDFDSMRTVEISGTSAAYLRLRGSTPFVIESAGQVSVQFTLIPADRPISFEVQRAPRRS